MAVDIFAPETIQSFVTDALTNVFTTMMSHEVTFVSASSFPNENARMPEMPVFQSGEGIVTGSVGFTGKANGIIYISMLEPTAKAITGLFLGMEPEEVEEEGHETVNDALGELTNMTVGDFKNKLCDVGYNCMLTLPSILRGNNLSIESNIDDGIRRYIHEFQMDGHSILVDLILKPEE